MSMDSKFAKGPSNIHLLNCCSPGLSEDNYYSQRARVSTVYPFWMLHLSSFIVIFDWATPSFQSFKSNYLFAYFSGSHVIGRFNSFSIVSAFISLFDSVKNFLDFDAYLADTGFILSCNILHDYCMNTSFLGTDLDSTQDLYFDIGFAFVLCSIGFNLDVSCHSE